MLWKICYFWCFSIAKRTAPFKNVIRNLGKYNWCFCISDSGYLRVQLNILRGKSTVNKLSISYFLRPQNVYHWSYGSSNITQISCFAEGVKVNVFNGSKTRKRLRVTNIFVGFFKVQTLNVKSASHFCVRACWICTIFLHFQWPPACLERQIQLFSISRKLKIGWTFSLNFQK